MGSECLWVGRNVGEEQEEAERREIIPNFFF